MFGNKNNPLHKMGSGVVVVVVVENLYFKTVGNIKQRGGDVVKTTLSAAKILNESITCSAVSTSVLSLVIKSRKQSN